MAVEAQGLDAPWFPAGHEEAADSAPTVQPRRTFERVEQSLSFLCEFVERTVREKVAAGSGAKYSNQVKRRERKEGA